MSTHGRTRDLGVDVARGVALVSMFVAHFAPSDGPGGVLLLSEFLTAPLFALLIGWGAVLGRGRLGEWSSVLVRTATLVGLGLLLEDAGAQIVVILVWLGVLTALCAVLVRLPDVVLGVLGVALLALAPGWKEEWSTRIGEWRFERMMAAEPAGGLYPWAVDLLVAGPYYRLTGLVLAAVVGILLARHGGRLVTWATGAAGVLLAAALVVADRRGELDLVPYSGTTEVLLLEVALVAAVAQAARLLAGWLPQVLSPLADAGRVTLSAYVAQIYVAAAWVRDREPGFRDDSWVLLGGMVVLSLALGWAWPRLVRRQPWSRGPLEGPERALADGLAWSVRRVRPASAAA